MIVYVKIQLQTDSDLLAFATSHHSQRPRARDNRLIVCSSLTQRLVVSVCGARQLPAALGPYVVSRDGQAAEGRLVQASPHDLALRPHLPVHRHASPRGAGYQGQCTDIVSRVMGQCTDIVSRVPKSVNRHCQPGA